MKFYKEFGGLILANLIDYTTEIDNNIRLYAKFLHKQYRCVDIGIELNTVYSLMTDTYLEVVNLYNPERGASFRTFLHKCCKNKIHRHVQGQIKDLSEVVNLNVDQLPDNQYLKDNEIAQVNIDINEITNHITGVESVIVREMISPSNDVIDYINANKAKHPRSSCSHSYLKNALLYAYGITRSQYNYARQNLKEVIKEAISEEHKKQAFAC